MRKFNISVRLLIEQIFKYFNIDLNLDFYHESRFNGSENAYTPICSSLAWKKIDSILVNHQRRERKDRFGTLISHDPHEFESEYQGEPPENRTHKPYKVTFKDKQMGESLAVIIEVESYKKFNNIETENKLWWTIM